MFVRWQGLIARSVAELFSFNRDVSHFYASCLINELSTLEDPYKDAKFSRLLALVYPKLAS